MTRHLGREFEKAVYAFVQTLAPSSEVIFDHHVIDRDTGALRQCDCWINTRIEEHWPISILISCKDRKRSGKKLDIGEIDTFIGEINSTGAGIGVLYCNTGFSKNALVKAKAHSVSCCRLFENEPADIPDIAWTRAYLYMAKPELELRLSHEDARFSTWGDVLDIHMDEKNCSLVECICSRYEQLEAESQSLLYSSTPSFHKIDIFTVLDNEDNLGIEVKVSCHWKKYGACSVFLDGSLSYAAPSFIGKVTTPSIDTFNYDNPGKDWVELEDSASIEGGVVMICPYVADLENRLVELYGARPIAIV